jgi:hypothetical protein
MSSFRSLQAPQDQRLQQEPRQGPPMGGGPSRPPMQGPSGRGSQVCGIVTSSRIGVTEMHMYANILSPAADSPIVLLPVNVCDCTASALLVQSNMCVCEVHHMSFVLMSQTHVCSVSSQI